MQENLEKKHRGLTLLIESLHKADPKLRSCAYNQDCFNELMFNRDEMITYAHKLLKELGSE